jgi:hypothetical protein
MNLFIGTATVMSISPVARSDGTTKYFFALQFDVSHYKAGVCLKERKPIISASGVPKAHHVERWANIIPGDVVYISGILNATDDGVVFLTIQDLGLACE